MNRIKKFLLALSVFFVVLAILLPIALIGVFWIRIGYPPRWSGINELILSDGTIIPAKTYWDFLGLIIFPFFLSIFLLLLENIEKNRVENEQKLNHEKQELLQQNAFEEAKLKDFFDSMSDLLLSNNLKKSEHGSPVRSIAYARTLSVLKQISSNRKAIVCRFLYQSGLILSDDSVISLMKADLRRVNFIGASFYGADFSGSNLNQSVFFKADLRDSNCRLVNFNGADLRNADFSGADLTRATFAGADLRGTIFEGADLSATNFDEAIVDG